MANCNISNRAIMSVLFLFFVMNLFSRVSVKGVPLDRYKNHTNNSSTNGSSNNEDCRVELYHINWEFVKDPLLVLIFILVVGLSKIGFHHSGVSAYLPESCLLIILGTIAGIVLDLTGHDRFQLNTTTFFLVLLPPIILEASYSLHDRAFYDNIGTILLFAIVGTLINFFLIGPSMYGIIQTGILGDLTSTISIKESVHLVDCFLFSSIIVAVDPVAVLAIFQELNVNTVLYFLVFGESLLNDAVTIVLYNSVSVFLSCEPPVDVGQIFLSLVKFLIVSLGGLLIGIICGIITALITRISKEVRLIEPLAMIGIAYLSYLLAELLEWSGIIALIGCGLAQAHYAASNTAKKSQITVKYFCKMLAAITESVIFLLLGISIVTNFKFYSWHFFGFSFLFCTIFRIFSVVSLTFLVNKFDRIKKITAEEQFVMAYGGLRGGIAFCLAELINTDSFSNEYSDIKQLFVTTTLQIVIATVFIQGATMRPIVRLLRIRLSQDEDPTVFSKLNDHSSEFLMAGIEEIVGHKIGNNALKMKLIKIDENLVKSILQRDPETREEKLMALYRETEIREKEAFMEVLQEKERNRRSTQIFESATLEKLKHLEQEQNNLVTRERHRLKILNREKTINESFRPVDIDGIIRANPSDVIHRPGRLDLINEDEEDLECQLQERQRRGSLHSLLALTNSITSTRRSSLNESVWLMKKPGNNGRRQSSSSFNIEMLPIIDETSGDQLSVSSSGFHSKTPSLRLSKSSSLNLNLGDSNGSSPPRVNEDAEELDLGIGQLQSLTHCVSEDFNRLEPKTELNPNFEEEEEEEEEEEKRKKKN